ETERVAFPVVPEVHPPGLPAQKDRITSSGHQRLLSVLALIAAVIVFSSPAASVLYRAARRAAFPIPPRGTSASRAQGPWPASGRIAPSDQETRGCSPWARATRPCAR